MYLLQIRISKFFDGEDFNDEKFSHYFFKLYDMLLSQEQIVDTPIFFSEGLRDLVECVSNLKFTKHGIRISKVPLA